MKMKYMVVPGKPKRFMLYFETISENKVFIEKDKNYNVFVVSAGINPKMLKAYGIVEKLNNATILAKNIVGEINDTHNLLMEQR